MAGSRNIFQLDDIVKQRIDNIVSKTLKVIVGDAKGADHAVQYYLFSKKYNNVEIFCMEGICRNNVGNWPIRKISAPNSRRDFVYYSTKDKAMGNEADYGFMLWDGQSRGTLRNIIQLVQKGKLVLVYLSQNRSLYTLKNGADLKNMLNLLGVNEGNST